MSDNAIRHLWVVRLPALGSKKPPTVLHSRKFPTVEKKAKLTHGDAYTPAPPTSSFLPLLVQEVTASQKASQFIQSRDQCDLALQTPAHRVAVENGVLWPVLAIEKNGLLLCCLPYVDEKAYADMKANNPQLNIPSIVLGFALLGALSDFLIVPSQDFSSRLAELPAFINEAAPFGLLRDSLSENVCARLANKPCQLSKSHKLPAWRASSYKGKALLHLTVSEIISASQCAQETWKDVSQVYGSVSCRAEFEGLTDITLNIAQQGDGLCVPLDSLFVHPCVQRADWEDLSTLGESKAAVRRIRFSPPVEQFTLCHYTVKRLIELPIFGVYHMKPEESKASITIQLKLNDQIKNSFEYCELRVPFHSRALISNLEATPTQGSVSLAGNRKEVIWNIGQKFTSKDQQALLAATVTFSSSEQALPVPNEVDAFCKGNNSYAQLNFKIQDFTHSGCAIDPKSILVAPSTKFKLNLSREYSTVDYKIWNSGGEALITLSADST